MKKREVPPLVRSNPKSPDSSKNTYIGGSYYNAHGKRYSLRIGQFDFFVSLVSHGESNRNFIIEKRASGHFGGEFILGSNQGILKT